MKSYSAYYDYSRYSTFNYKPMLTNEEYTKHKTQIGLFWRALDCWVLIKKLLIEDVIEGTFTEEVFLKANNCLYFIDSNSLLSNNVWKSSKFVCVKFKTLMLLKLGS